MTEMTEYLLTILVTVLALTTVTGWALSGYLLFVLRRDISLLDDAVSSLDKDIGEVWQQTFPAYGPYTHARIDPVILPFMKLRL